MKSRNLAVAFINNQMLEDGMPKQIKYGPHHYGRVELKALMDFIYCGEPESINETIKKDKYHVKDVN